MSSLPLLFAAAAGAIVYGRKSSTRPSTDATAGAVVSDEIPITDHEYGDIAIGVPEPSYTAVNFSSSGDQAMAKSHLRSGLYSAVPVQTGVAERTSTLSLAPTQMEGFPYLLGRRHGTRE